MAQAQKIGHYQFQASDRLFFDANIWIELFDCRSNRDKNINSDFRKIYNGAFARALKSKSRLFAHPFVISEFVNRLLRDEHNFLLKLNEAHSDYKMWRQSGSYRIYSEVVAARTRQILAPCTLIEDNFDNDALLDCLTNFEEDSRDLNDEFLIKICERHDLTLVTHDGDFSHCNLNILTTNSAYLR